MPKTVFFVGNSKLADECCKYAQSTLENAGNFFVKRISEFSADCKTADAVLFVQNDTKTIAEKLGLYAEMKYFDKHIVVCGSQCEVSRSRVGQGSIGREMAETVVFRELDIEKIARIAFDYAEKNGLRILSVDTAGYLPNGLFWRKAVREVATDYPYVSMEDVDAPLFIGKIAKGEESKAIILTNCITGGMISDVITTLTGERLQCVSLLGETSLGAFGVKEDGTIDGFKRAIKMMFSESFDKEIPPEIFIDI